MLEFGEEFFKMDGSIVYCKLCEIKVSCEKKYNVQCMYGEKNMGKLLKDTKMKFLHYFSHFDNNLVVSQTLMPIYV